MTNIVSESTIFPISEIAILSDVNIRELDIDYVSELMQAQVEYGKSHWQTHWKEKPKINQDGILFSGFHTITAAKRNFGNNHEVSFQVVEGDPYLLAACENAVHGKRRTNADKRAAVLRWLQDDKGKQWTDSHIAKQCHVSDFLVNSVDLSLQENGSDTYDRPTKRKYIDKHGNVTWMETAKINDATGKSEKVIAEETVKSLWEQINPAISTWKKEREGVGHASKSMFIKATLRFMGLPSDTETNTKVLKNLLELLTSKETDVLETLVRKQLEGNSLWGNASVDAETGEKETAQPSQTAEEREANKLLKQKKQVIKSLWDKRKQAARDWMGTEDNDLTTYTDLDELEKAFVASEDHAYCADAFQSGMRRTSEQTFNICLEKTLASDVSLEDLNAEYKALHTYALDILTWERQEWIQHLIDKKRKKTEAAETPSESADSEIDVEAIQRDIVKAREKADAEGGMVSFRPIANKYGIDAEEVGRIAAAIQGASSRETSEEAPDTDTDLEKALESLMTAVDQFDACFLHDADFDSDDYSKLCDLAAVEFECDRDMLYQIVHEEDCPEHFDEFELTKWEMIVRQMLEAIKSNADWVKCLRADDPSEVEKANTETTEVEIALYHDLNHLRVLQNTLSPLLKRLGADDMARHDREILTADLNDVFLQYEQVPTEKEMVVALLDLAHSILFEEIPND